MAIVDRIPASPPIISPVSSGEIRPLWSVMIPAYNCSQYLEQAIQSVVDQYMGADKMQIEVIDDCSTDANVAALVNRVGKGIVQYYRKEKTWAALGILKPVSIVQKGILYIFYMAMTLFYQDFILNWNKYLNYTQMQVPHFLIFIM